MVGHPGTIQREPQLAASLTLRKDSLCSAEALLVESAHLRLVKLAADPEDSIWIIVANGNVH